MAGISRPSPELLAANARMLAMRQQLRQVEQHTPLKSKAVVNLPDLSMLPTHLGWGSAAVTAVLRRSHPSSHEDSKQAAQNNPTIRMKCRMLPFHDLRQSLTGTSPPGLGQAVPGYWPGHAAPGAGGARAFVVDVPLPRPGRTRRLKLRLGKTNVDRKISSLAFVRQAPTA